MKPVIVLINCFSGNPVPPDAPPYGLLYVGSALQRSGYSVQIFDRHLDITQDTISFCEQFLTEKNQIFALGGVASAYKDAIEIASYLKSQKPSCKIIAGGYLGATAECLLFKTPIDAIVRGEGEITAVKLVEALINNKPLEDIRGISFLKDGILANTAHRKQIDNLDEIPFPNYELVGMENYLIPGKKAPYFRLDPRHAKYKGTLIDIKTSRGCVNRCSFCYRHMNGMRHHSPEYVLNHIKYLQDTYNADFFNISDELTISSSEWVEEFCRKKEEKNLDFLFRINSARVDLVDEQMLVKLKNAGMVAITFGIESGSQKMLDNMHKHTTVKQNLIALKLCHKLDIQTTIALVIGLPGENFKTVIETSRFLMNCPKHAFNKEYEYDDMNDLRVFTPIAFPGTLLYKQGLEMGIISDEHTYLCSLNDNQVMRSYNFTNYSNIILKLWSNGLYFIYRSGYYWEKKEIINLFKLIWRSVIYIATMGNRGSV